MRGGQVGRGWPAEADGEAGRNMPRKKGRNGLFPLEEERQIANGQVWETELDSGEKGPELGEVDPLSRINRLNLLTHRDLQGEITNTCWALHTCWPQTSASQASYPALACAPAPTVPTMVRTIVTLPARADRELLITCPDSTLSLGGVRTSTWGHHLRSQRNKWIV